MTPRQCKAARALLGWSQGDLAAAARVSRRTVAAFESEAEARRPFPAILDAMSRALSGAGLVLAEDGSEGVAKRAPSGPAGTE
jgi:transcriptional regulator with XRE-family HTH domain